MRTRERERLQTIFAEAVALRDRGQLKAALATLDRFNEVANGTSVGGDVLRGGILWDLGRLEEAITTMQRVLAVRPCHQLASSVLVHSLLEAGSLDDAHAQATRYLDRVASGDAARASENHKNFYRDIVKASRTELEALSRSLRAAKPSKA